MDWLGLIEVVKDVPDAAFRGLVLAALVYGVRQLGQMRKTMESLNASIAVVVERTTNHEKRITRLEGDNE